MKNTKTQTLTRLAILSALIFLLHNVPIKIFVEVTFGMLPVAIGAITMGTTSAIVLGAIFGTASFLQCFGIFIPSEIGMTLFSANPLFTILLCYLPRIAMAFLVSIIFKAFKKKTVFAYGFSSLMAAVFNTIFFVSLLLLLFWNNEAFIGLCNKYDMDRSNVFLFAVTFASINAIVEAVVCCILGGAGAKAVDVVTKRLK